MRSGYHWRASRGYRVARARTGTCPSNNDTDRYIDNYQYDYANRYHHPDGYSCPYADTRPDRDQYANANANSRSNTYSQTDADSQTYSDATARANADTSAAANSGSHADAGKAYADRDAASHCHCRASCAGRRPDANRTTRHSRQQQ